MNNNIVITNRVLLSIKVQANSLHIHNPLMNNPDIDICILYTGASLLAVWQYRIAGNIGGNLNLVDWRFGKKTAKLNFT